MRLSSAGAPLRLVSFQRRCVWKVPRKKRDKSLDEGRVSQYPVAQRGIRQARQHCNLHGGQDFPRVYAEPGESEDAVGVNLNQCFQESACF